MVTVCVDAGSVMQCRVFGEARKWAVGNFLLPMRTGAKSATMRADAGLTGEVGESTVAFSHLVDVFTLFNTCTSVVVGVYKL